MGTDLVRNLSADSENSRSSDSYFSTMAQMQEAISKHDFERAARSVRENIQQLSEFVKGWRLEYGKFDISSIPGLEQGGTVLALIGDDAGISEMQQIVASIPDLKPWVDHVARHAQDRQLFITIMDAIAAHPNCLQTELKDLTGQEDGRHVAILISYLDKAGKIARIKEGRTYRLALSGSPEAPPPPNTVIVKSHRSDRNPPPLHEIDISSLAYIPLPRAPLQWEEKEAGQERAKIQQATDAFEVFDTAEWRIISNDKVPMADRADPAFRQMHPTNAGLFMIDDLGNAQGLGQIEAAALQYDRLGKPAAKAGFQHGIYRLGIHPLGQGLIAMSKECVIHAYDGRLQLLFQTALAQSPEIESLRMRVQIPDDQLKNHIRCVAFSKDGARYLFTAVDEAWCVNSDGKGLWGAKLPIKQGWTRVATPSDSFATSAEVHGALAAMGLSLPVTPEDVKRRYRQLAKEWHPDVNPNNSEAEEKMKALNAAAEALTGVNMNSLPHYAGATFVSEMARTDVQVGGIKFTVTLGLQGGEAMAADWIYAASFAARSNSVYLAGYSGRVVLVDERGKAVRVYDIGTVPRRIVDTGDYLYLLTNTRLYVLHDEALHAVIDTYDGGDFVVAQTGFGLLEKNRMRWFSQNGTYLGSVISKDPIRRVYSTPKGMVVETRQRRAMVDGVPGWWKNN